MALEYFLLPDNETPNPVGDAYTTRARMDIILGSNVATCAWAQLGDDAKDDLIKAETSKLDGLSTCGSPVDDAQPLNFPLTGLSLGYDPRAIRAYSIAEQVKKLERAMANQIEADIQKGSISQLSTSQGRETVKDLMFDIHPMAKRALARFI